MDADSAAPAAPAGAANAAANAVVGVTQHPLLRRREDARLITGRGRFLHDLVDPAEPAGCFVRSPHARARILAIDVDAALADPEVIGVLTAADLADEVRARCHVPDFNPLVKGVHAPRHPLLAQEAVTVLGQPVALVVARSRAAAIRAAEAVFVDYAPEDAICDGDPNAPQWLSFALTDGAEPAPADIAQRVAVAHRQPRVSAVPMETRATIARWNADDGSLTAWVPTQAPSRARDDIARVVGLEPAQVTVICPDVGGAFGAKASIYPEDLLVCVAARHFGVTVQWLSTRSEDFLAGFQGRGGQLQGELAIGHDGQLLGLRAEVRFPLGAWLPFSAVVPTRNAARILPGPYRVGAIQIQGSAYGSDTAPMNIYRGAGRPEATILMESLMDAAARARGEDRVEFRRRALLPPSVMPWHTPTGERLDSGNYPALLDAACDRFGYAAECAARDARRARGERVGIGIAFYVEPCGQGWESARVTLHADGRVTVASGSAAQGQGHETTYARIAAEALGCDESTITILHGDTRTCPTGIGALASRSIAIGGSAIVAACRAARARQAAGEVLPLTEDTVYTVSGEAWSAGCVFARMAVDIDTGQPRIERIVWIDDAGRVISPQLVEGQLLGGLAQGFGQAMMERIIHDDQGQLLTGSLLDYALPRASDMPPVELGSLETASPMNLLGAKGVGEAGCIGVPAALRSAALDALAQDGVESLDFPLTAERLWRAIREAQTPAPKPE